MIAPLKTEPDERSFSTRRRLRAARRVIATMLLTEGADQPSPVARWKAWLLVAWAVLAVAIYAVLMSGVAERFGIW
ncbi:MAG TPA: hypothetical protein VF306_07875 [Pirellulales bacterium]